MERARLILVGLFVISVAACGHEGSPVVPSTPPPVSRFPGAPPNGHVTLTSAATTLTLCSQLTQQIGASWNAWLQAELTGDSATLSFWDDGPPNSSPLQDPPEIFTGTRNGDAIVEHFDGAPGWITCGSLSLLHTDGALHATLSGNQLIGDYTEVYGARSELTLTMHFDATLPQPAANPTTTTLRGHEIGGTTEIFYEMGTL